MGDGTNGGEGGRKERLRFYNQALRDQWGKYLQLPNQMVLLSAGTALLFLQNLPKGWGTITNAGFGKAALALSGASLVFSLVWRLVAQSLMEYETLVPESELDLYYREAGIERVVIKVNGPGMRNFWRRGYHYVPWFAYLSLLASWYCIVMFWPN